MTGNFLVMCGGVRARKSVFRISTQTATLPVWTGLEMDTHKRQKCRLLWLRNPNVEYLAVGELSKAELRCRRPVVVEESFVEESYVSMPVRWAGFDQGAPNVAGVWPELMIEEALQRKPDSKFLQEGLRAEYAGYLHRCIVPNEWVACTGDVTQDQSIEPIRARPTK